MEQKTAFITGILGQDGPYLAKFLLEKNYRVYGMMRRYSNPNFSNTDFLGISHDIEFVIGDMTDEASLISLMKTVRPDEVYNLAAQSFVGSSWQLAKLTTEINALGVLYLLNAIKLNVPTARFYQASTSEMYGNASKPILDESSGFAPRSPYGISKLYSFWITNNYRESYGMYCANGILFNHESPIRGIEFVTRKISDGVAKIKLGKSNKLRLGNLDAQRDWGFAGDYVEAMWQMLQQERADNFVIATGEIHSVRDFLSVAFEYVGIKDWDRYIAIDPRFKRPAEINVLCGDATKAQNTFGWEPKVSFKALVQMMVEADMARLSKRL